MHLPVPRKGLGVLRYQVLCYIIPLVLFTLMPAPIRLRSPGDPSQFANLRPPELLIRVP